MLKLISIIILELISTSLADLSISPKVSSPKVSSPEVSSPKESSPIESSPKESPLENSRYVVMMRHGETEWSKEGIFCGWYDSPLTEKGKNDAHSAAEQLKNFKYNPFDTAYTSVLQRADVTLEIILNDLNLNDCKVVKSWKLIERHYGALTGLNKEDVQKSVGEQMVNIWRRSYDIAPPAMNSNHKYYNSIIQNLVLKEELEKDGVSFPACETLKTTKERVIPFWDEQIYPKIKNGEKILIVAHGTVLRSLIMHLEEITEEDICDVNVPPGIPFVYEWDEQMNLIKNNSIKYLGDPEKIAKLIKKTKAIKRLNSDPSAIAELDPSYLN